MITRSIIVSVILLGMSTLGIAARSTGKPRKLLTRAQAHQLCVQKINETLTANPKLREQAVEETRQAGILLDDYIREYCTSIVEEAIRSGSLNVLQKG